MALKLGKCRLCLKLGDFYSIFTVDNSLQLAEMVMECTKIKIYEGDGLPDKVCSECIQKLSSAYIFKQQCERSDEELRRNYVPPPGFSIPNRQSSDSTFYTHTDTSNQTKKLSTGEQNDPPPGRGRKRSHESESNTSASSKSHEQRPTSSKRVEELRNEKRPRIKNTYSDFEYEDYSVSHFSTETDSDEPLLGTEDDTDFKCKLCPKKFKSKLSLNAHCRIHSNKFNMKQNVVVDIPNVPNTVNAVDDDSKQRFECEICKKTFKLKIMLKRHSETCGKDPTRTPQISPQKELLITLEPIDKILNDNKYNCEMCTTKFKTIDNLEKHMKVCHAAVLNRNRFAPKYQEKETNDNGAVTVPCIFCNELFDDYYIHSAHYNSCLKRDDSKPIECPLCGRTMTKRQYYFVHLKRVHFEPMGLKVKTEKPEEYECRMCSQKLPSQEQLITHLAAHMSNIEAPNANIDEESRPSTIEDSASLHSEYSGNTSRGTVHCRYCEKEFQYKKALQTHEMKHTTGEIPMPIKSEPPDKNESANMEESYREWDSDSSQGEGDDNTCDICEKQFSYRRLLLHHKRTKHNMSSGTKRSKILLKDCPVRCLICDIEMKVSEINEHNQKHITANMKPRNVYTCSDCKEKFKSCSGLANHIKLVHRLKQQPPPKMGFDGPDLADFCEVVVTKAEPLDTIQSHNGFGEVPLIKGSNPLVNLTGFDCTTCGKKMPTLISLKRHMNWHINVGDNIQKLVECFVCKETFRFQCHYKLHMREHYKDPNIDPRFLTCTICNRKSKHLRAAQAHMNFHKQTRFKSKDYQCSICKRIFQHRKVYLSHMAIHYKRGESTQNTVVGDALPNTVDKTVYDGSFTCHLCGKVCDSENSLKCHVRWHSSKTSLFGARHECPFCHLQFTNKRRMEIHVRTHFENDDGPFKCTICGKGFTDEEYFRRHVKGHNFDHQSHKKRIEKLRKGKVKCPICVRYYPDVVKLIRHLRRTHPESKMIKEDPDAPPKRYYSCKLCAKVFLDEKRLQHHEEAHLRKPEFFKCKFCDKKTISMKNHRIHIKGHLAQKFLDNPLQCPHCEETFTKGYGLHHHLRDAHGVNETWIAERKEMTLDGPLKERQCAICYKILASKGNYERHIDYHNTLRCNYCFEYFNTSRFLEGHLAFSCEKKKLIGDVECYPKKVKCNICYKAFHIQVKLDCHLRTQHGVKVNKEKSIGKQEIVCDYCFRVFENEDALNTHKIYHRTVGYYGCIYCNKKFNTLTVYRKHKNHHFAQLNVDEPTKCEHCDETFVAFREMIYHMRDVHGDDKEWIVMPKESIEETCHICNKTFFNLHKHLSYHEDNRCKKCSEYFYSRLDFDNHLCAIESEEEPEDNETDLRPKYEECSFCFKPVTKSNSKRLHDNIHKGSGSISCRFCPLKFKTMDAFNIHAFSHRSRKYNKNPLKCRKCGEKFIRYGPFVKHLKSAHKITQKMHYRAIVKPEPCVVCKDYFPNLHNHYRAHLLNQCQLCCKYFTSAKVFSTHKCDQEDSDPSKVFTSDANLHYLINTYVAKDKEGDEEKYYGFIEPDEPVDEPETVLINGVDEEYVTPTFEGLRGDDSQNSEEVDHMMNQSPVISDVLSLFKERKDEETSQNGDVINLSDEDSVDFEENNCPTITIDD